MHKDELPCGSLTLSHLQDIKQKLEQHVCDDLAVEYYPDQPRNYHLKHPKGALLLSYAKSNYSDTDETALIVSDREMIFTITIVSRSLHVRHGIVPQVDFVIAMLSGFKPKHCTKPLRPVDDRFEDEHNGLWFHAVDMKTQGVHMQNCDYNPPEQF